MKTIKLCFTGVFTQEKITKQKTCSDVSSSTEPKYKKELQIDCSQFTPSVGSPAPSIIFNSNKYNNLLLSSPSERSSPNLDILSSLENESFSFSPSMRSIRRNAIMGKKLANCKTMRMMTSLSSLSNGGEQ